MPERGPCCHGEHRHSVADEQRSISNDHYYCCRNAHVQTGPHGSRGPDCAAHCTLRPARRPSYLIRPNVQRRGELLRERSELLGRVPQPRPLLPCRVLDVRAAVQGLPVVALIAPGPRPRPSSPSPAYPSATAAVLVPISVRDISVAVAARASPRPSTRRRAPATVGMSKVGPATAAAAGQGFAVGEARRWSSLALAVPQVAFASRFRSCSSGAAAAATAAAAGIVRGAGGAMLLHSFCIEADPRCRRRHYRCRCCCVGL